MSPGTPTDGAVMPWAQVVSGATESPSAVAVTVSPRSLAPSPSEQTPNSDCSSPKAGNSSALMVTCSLANGDVSIGSEKKKPAWNKKPSNGVTASPSEAGPSVVLGGPDFWPDLSEAAKAPNKPSSSDSSASDSQGAAKANHSKSSGNNGNPSSARDHSAPARQRSMRHAQAPAVSLPIPAPQTQPVLLPLPLPIPTPAPQTAPPPLPLPTPFFHDAYGNPIPPHQVAFRRPVVQYPPHQQHRRGSFGPHNGNNYGGQRREHDRGYNGHLRRGPPPPPPPHPRGYYGPPPPPSPHGYASPQPVRQFHNPMGFPDFGHPMRPAPYMTPSPPPIINSPSLVERIATQIDFYFSDVNLATDSYLKDQMDQQGWVPVPIIARFRRIQTMTDDFQLILNALNTHSTEVQVQGEMIRKRNTWMNFLRSWDQSPSSVASSFQQMALGEDEQENRASEPQLSNGELAHSN